VLVEVLVELPLVALLKALLVLEYLALLGTAELLPLVVALWA
jgi:hypothetical protein